MVRSCLRRLDRPEPDLRLFALAAGHRLADLDVPDSDPSAWPDLLGQIHQRLLARDQRHRRGVFYTAADIADAVVALAIDATGEGGARTTDPPTVCDPATGGGAFLLAAARLLARLGVPPDVVVERCLWGVDVDPLAVAVTEAALHLWAAERGAPAASTQVVIGDTIADGIHVWPDAPPGFDAVVGNPPFQNQLGTSTARTAERIDAMRERYGEVVQAYSDTATLFLVQAVAMASPGGRVAMLQPQSFIMARDAAPARQHLLDEADLVGLWHCRDFLFDAQVRVCAPVLRRRGDGRHTRAALSRYVGPDVEPVPKRRWRSGEPASLSTWSPLVSDLLGVPDVTLDAGSTLREWSRATAGFRDQYYGLVGRVLEQSELSDTTGATCRLLTSGVIETGRDTWGSRPLRFGGVRWDAPLIALDELDPKLRQWADEVLVPKVVVATQTKVIEAAVDENGSWYPSVPVIAVIPHDPARLWHLAAALSAPPVSAWAWAKHAGGALSADTIKLAARELLELPAPPDAAAWDRGARAARVVAAAKDADSWRTALDDLGIAMCAAYEVDPDDVLAWWRARLPRWR